MTVDGPIGLRLSASQVTLFRNCKRAWAYSYILGERSPSTPAQALGTAVHKQLENYLSGGAFNFTEEAGAIAASALEFLPKPGTLGMYTEREFHIRGPSGHSYLGYIDLEQEHISKITDFKTTGDLKWKKTEAELLSDPQANLYAANFFFKFPERPEVTLEWLYMRKKGARKAAVTRLTVGQEHVLSQFNTIEKTAEEMAEVQERLDDVPREELPKRILELAPSRDFCTAYSGCPYLNRFCTDLSPLHALGSYLKKEKTRTMTALMKKMVEPAQVNPPEQHLAPPPVQVAPPPAAAAPTQVPVAAPTGSPSVAGGLLQRVRANAGLSAPTGATTIPVAPQAPVAQAAQQPAEVSSPLTDVGIRAALHYGVTPEDCTPEMVKKLNAGLPPTPFHGEPPPAAPPVAPPPLPPVAKKRGRPSKADKAAAEAAALAAENAPDTTPPADTTLTDAVMAAVAPLASLADVMPPAAAPAPKKNLLLRRLTETASPPAPVEPPLASLSTPSRYDTAPSDGAVSAPDPTHGGVFNTAGATTGRTSSAAPNASNGPRAEVQKPPAGKNIGLLCIDCSPSSGFTPGEEIIAIAKEYLANMESIEDYREVEFGKGNAYLAQAVAHALDRAGTLEAVRLDTRLQEYGAVAHEFLIRAKVVVR